MKKLLSYISSGLRQRWIRGSILLILGALLVVIVTFSIITYNYYYSTVSTGLISKAQTAMDFYTNYVAQDSEYYEYAYKYIDSFEDAGNLELQFLHTDGRVMVSTYGITAGTSPNSSDIKDAIETGTIQSWHGRRSATGERVLSVSAPLYSGGQLVGVMRYVTSLKLVDAQVRNSVLTICGVGAIMLMLVIGMNLLFVSSVIEPVGEITKMSKRIAEGSYGVQISNEYNDEIGDMVTAINEMSMKIAQTEKIQTEFISSISHELRTPLTAITGWGETLVYNTALDEETRRGIEIMLKEARRLTKMVEELLEFTRMQDGRFTLNIEQVDLALELEDSIFAYRELLHQGEMSLVYEPYEGDMMSVPGDPSRLRQVFFNLLDNATKYAKEGGKIVVSMDVNDGFYEIKVRDFGTGIPEDELDNVRMKFYKGSNAKERGSGIGLAVCDEIIKYHGGSMILENAEGGGLLVTLLLPMDSETTL